MPYAPFQEQSDRQAAPWSERECMSHMREIAVEAGLIFEPGHSAIRLLKGEVVDDRVGAFKRLVRGVLETEVLSNATPCNYPNCVTAWILYV